MTCWSCTRSAEIGGSDGMRCVVTEQPTQAMDHFSRAPIVGRDVLENGAHFDSIEVVSREHTLRGSGIR